MSEVKILKSLFFIKNGLISLGEKYFNNLQNFKYNFIYKETRCNPGIKLMSSTITSVQSDRKTG